MNEQSTLYNPATSGKARAFIIPGGARFGRRIMYTSYMRVDSTSEPLGDITPMRLNDPNSFESYVERGLIRGSRERPTSQLIQKMPIEIMSMVDRLARRRINFDVHVQFGECHDPSNIREFSKGIVYEFATGTTKDRDALIALDDTEESEIRETLGISARCSYSYVPLAYRNRALDTVVNEILGVCFKLTRDCDDDSIDPLPMFAVTAAEGGSPGTGPYILWSLDEGDTWNAHEVDTLLNSQDATAVAVANGYIQVISETAGSLNFVEIDDFYFPDEVGFDPAFAEITTGFSDAPRDIVSVGRNTFICGDAGYIYKVAEPSEGAIVLDAGEAAGGTQLNSIDAFDEKHIVAVGDTGKIIFSTDGENFSESPSQPVGIGINAEAVGIRYEDEWWVGFDDGTLYMTYDAGQHWSQVTLAGQSNITAVTDIKWSSHSIGYVSVTKGAHGEIYRTVCGGIEWTLQPQQSKYSMPANGRFNSIAVNPENVNIVLGGGLAVDAVDGSLIVGNEAQV